MRRFLILLCIFGPSIVIAVSISAVRSTRALADRAASENRTGIVIVPAGTFVRLRLVGNISNAIQAGGTRQAITSTPTTIGMQTLIPTETRALVRILSIEKRPEGKAEVTLQLQKLMSQNRDIPVHSDVITAELSRSSDFEVLRRAASGLIGGAIGASGGAVIKNDPRLGAAAIGGMAVGMGAEEQEASTLSFQILSPIDLTGIKW
jgi:hypothetical protein